MVVDALLAILGSHPQFLFRVSYFFLVVLIQKISEELGLACDILVLMARGMIGPYPKLHCWNFQRNNSPKEIVIMLFPE